jgi:hypothetical protein
MSALGKTRHSRLSPPWAEDDSFLPVMASVYKGLVPSTERIVDLTKQLRYHAGLEPDLRLGVPSLSDVLWKKTSITASVDDVLRLLHLLNHEVNGLVPSASTEDHGQFSRQLIYAVTEIIELLRAEHHLPDTENHPEQTVRFCLSNVGNDERLVELDVWETKSARE